MKIIGGIYPAYHKSEHVEGTTFYLANARCALYMISEKINPGTVWLPDFHCPSIQQAFGSKIQYYHVNKDLTVIPPEVRHNDLVVAINYFGCHYDESINVVKDKGALVVADMSQAFFSDPPDADFLVYSPRKFFPIPDGGILISKIYMNMALRPQTWFCENLLAMQARKDDENNNKKWYEMSVQAKEKAPVGAYAMSQYSRNIMSSFNEPMSTENFEFLLNKLEPYALIKKSPKHIPYGFPILVPNRDLIQSLLFEKNIYLPIQWPVDHELAKDILTIPCDYRYTIEDMDYITECLYQCLEVSIQSGT